MQTHMKTFIALFLGAALVVGSAVLAGAQEMGSAKVGIEVITEGGPFSAKPNDTIIAGSRFRVHVIPEEACHVYVVRANQKVVRLVGKTRVEGKTTKTFPATSDSFQLDATDGEEWVTVICSPAELPEVTAFFDSSDVSYGQWEELQKGLRKKSKIVLAKKIPSKPHEFGVTTKATIKRRKWDIGNLTTFSGRPFLIKRFRFDVEK